MWWIRETRNGRIVAAAELSMPRPVREIGLVKAPALTILCEPLTGELHHLTGAVNARDARTRIADQNLLRDRTEASADIEHVQVCVCRPRKQLEEEGQLFVAP